MMEFRNTKLALRRHPLSYSKVQHMLGPLMRAWPARRHPNIGDYLNVGCGPFGVPGFFNIDYDFRPGVDLFWDIVRPLPIADASVGGIFTEHCIEHIAFADTQKVLRDFLRVLQPGARVRIIVPDGELYLRAYADNSTLPYQEADAARVNGTYQPMMSVNRIFMESGHRFIYDFATLRDSLDRAGFTDIAKCQFGMGIDPKLLIDQKIRAVESLYVEARKPV